MFRKIITIFSYMVILDVCAQFDALTISVCYVIYK